MNPTHNDYSRPGVDPWWVVVDEYADRINAHEGVEQ